MGKEISSIDSDEPDVLPTGNGCGTAWSPDGQYMSVAHTSPFITIYKRNGDIHKTSKSRCVASGMDGTHGRQMEII